METWDSGKSLGGGGEPGLHHLRPHRWPGLAKGRIQPGPEVRPAAAQPAQEAEQRAHWRTSRTLESSATMRPSIRTGSP